MSSKLPSSPASAPAGATNAAAGAAMNPADIAREAFRRLATRRIAPTPSAYRDIYNEIAGISEPADTPAAPADFVSLNNFQHVKVHFLKL